MNKYLLCLIGAVASVKVYGCIDSYFFARKMAQIKEAKNDL